MPTRRAYCSAFAVLLGGPVAGCTGEEMTDEEAHTMLEDITHVGDISDPESTGETQLYRAIDRDAGVVLYVEMTPQHGGGGVTAVPIDETALPN
jgi:hypothetical protein